MSYVRAHAKRGVRNFNTDSICLLHDGLKIQTVWDIGKDGRKKVDIFSNVPKPIRGVRVKWNWEDVSKYGFLPIPS